MLYIFFKYTFAICANCKRFVGLQLVFAPASTSITPFLYDGSIGAIAGLSTPFILPTSKVAPVSNAPEFPAETNTSPSPSFNNLKPTTIEESFLCFIACVGMSSIVISSVVLCIIILSDISFILSFPYSSFTFLFIFSSFPTKIISELISFIAFTAPLIVASGALSPPIASKIIFIRHSFC